MTTTPHLSPDDLDALLVGAMNASIRTHLGECGSCRALAASDRVVVTAVERLPRFSPHTDFPDRVMARVDITRSPIRSILGLTLRLPAGVSVRLAASVGGVLLVGLAASVIWSLGNREVLAAWGQQALGLVSSWLWLGVQTLAANLTEQPWYDSVRTAVGSPVRLAASSVALVATWGAGMLALKRLVTAPSRTA